MNSSRGSNVSVCLFGSFFIILIVDGAFIMGRVILCVLFF